MIAKNRTGTKKKTYIGRKHQGFLDVEPLQQPDPAIGTQKHAYGRDGAAKDDHEERQAVLVVRVVEVRDNSWWWHAGRTFHQRVHLGLLR